MSAGAPAAARPQTNALSRLVTPARAFDLAAVAVVVVFAVRIADFPLTSGDYGQWLMVSRYYSGESVPGYRDIWAVAPLVPLLLAGTRFVLQEPIAALEAIRLLFLFALGAAFYCSVASIFRSRAAGLLAVVAAFATTPHFAELFAFGGLLQIASLGFMLVGLGALARASAGDSNERAWWILASGAMSLAVLSHAGSVIIVIPVALSAAGVTFARNRSRRELTKWARFLAPALMLPALAVVYWMLILVPANAGYSDNPAAAGYRGPDALFENLTSTRLTIGVMVFAFAAAGIGAGREVARRTPGRYSLASAWLLATWAVLLGTIATGTQTDYPRFATPLLAPVVGIAAGAAAEGAYWLTNAVRRHRPALIPAHAAPFYLAGLVMLIAAPMQLDTLQRQANFYGLSDRSSIEVLARWVDESLPEDQQVLVLEPRDGKWVEGLTGHPALFGNKTRFSFRSEEWERSVAADAMVRSTTAMTNGLVSAKFMDVADGPREDVPRGLLVGVNHDGEWVDLLRLPEGTARILSPGMDGETLATLGALAPVSVERSATDDAVSVRTTWTGTRMGAPVTWVRTVSLNRDSLVVDLVDEVSTTAPLHGLEVELASFQGPAMETSLDDGAATASFTRMGNRKPAVEVRLVDAGGEVVQRGDRLVARVGGPRMHLQFVARTAGQPISSLALLYPHQLMEDYNIGAAILKRDGAFDARLARLEALGMRVVMEAGAYVLLARDDIPVAGAARAARAGP